MLEKRHEHLEEEERFEEEDLEEKEEERKGKEKPKDDNFEIDPEERRRLVQKHGYRGYLASRQFNFWQTV